MAIGKLVVWLLVCTAFADIGQAHVGEHIYPIRQFPVGAQPDLHDGTLADWLDLFPRPTLTKTDFGTLELGDSAPIGSPDLTTNIYLGWTRSPPAIYLAVERWDNVYINGYDGDIFSTWRGDSIEFMIDGDHSGGNFGGPFGECLCHITLEEALADGVLDEGDACCLDINRHNRQAQLYQATALGPSGRLHEIVSENRYWVTASPYSDAGGFVTDGQPPSLSP
ncbi:MAG: hypothetical protein GKR89_14900 [Candidatus Latescibacteria bacterium]|nr:hypothetical protein [Candidatus Latescibacterota bacterium]